MTDNDLYTLGWKVFASVLIVLILTVGGCSSYKTAKVTEALANGVDPIALQCLTESGNNAACIILATKR